MTYHDQWRALSSRIRGLSEAAELQARYQAQGGDDHGAVDYLHRQLADIVASLKTLRDEAGDRMPADVMRAIERLFEKALNLVADRTGTNTSRRHRTWSLIVRLRAFEAEMSFLLADAQETIRLRSERAFAHLQRLIVADADFTRKWHDALRNDETACEKLGGAHLLSHGIWAFKAYASGGRTDLVFQDRVDDLSGIERFAEGIVLTEWKRALRPGDALKKFEEARAQARDYAGGILAGFELTAYRYAIVVTEEQVQPPKDEPIDGVVWRHINIAVNPLTPSKAALRATRTRTRRSAAGAVAH